MNIGAPMAWDEPARIPPAGQVGAAARRAKGLAAALLLALGGAGPVAAQAPLGALPVHVSPAAATGRQDEPGRRPPVARMAGLGLLGGVVAGAAVAIPFYLALNDSGCEVCTGLVIAVPAVFLAYGTGQALGVHLGNGRRGNFLADLGVSLLATAAGAGLGALGGRDTALLGVVVGLGATVWMESAHRE